MVEQSPSAEDGDAAWKASHPNASGAHDLLSMAPGVAKQRKSVIGEFLKKLVVFGDELRPDSSCESHVARVVDGHVRSDAQLPRQLQ